MRALTEAVAELGYPNVTIAEIVSRAGVAKPTFYDHFDDKEQCFLSVYDEIAAAAFATVNEKLEHAESVVERIVVGVTALLAFFSEDDARTRLMLIEAENAGPAAVSRHDSTMRAYAVFYISLREQSREFDPELAPISMTRAESIVGAIHSPVKSALRSGGADRITALTDDLIAAVTALALAPS